MLFILIPGLILVALMVYVSTRIKKTAAAAFDAETIETDEFIIQKPEGFLHKLNGDPKYVFEAYSKEHSKVNDRRRLAFVSITRVENTSLEKVASDVLQDAELVADGSQIIAERPYRLLTLNRGHEGQDAEMLYKLGEKNGNVYKLEIASLDGACGSGWAETFLNSFRVK